MICYKHSVGRPSKFSADCAKLPNVADDVYMNSIMYDSTHMDRSKYYFKILQFLRIMHDSVDDLDGRVLYWSTNWREAMRRDRESIGCTTQDLEHLIDTWQAVQTRNSDQLNQLRRRIERKQREIESLRDGVSSPADSGSYWLTNRKLFNATSVREALLAGRTNQNIMVFTIVTIAFLPLTFVTVSKHDILPRLLARTIARRSDLESVSCCPCCPVKSF